MYLEVLARGITEKGIAAQQALLAWAALHGRDYAWRWPERTPYGILVAEILLKRTTACAAARIYEGFLGQFPSVEALAAASEDELAQAFAPVGLQWQRARAVRRLARYLVTEESGEIPCDLDRLLKVPGLGQYSARAILTFGYGVPAAVVDANVARVLSRVFQRSLTEKPGRMELQRLADKLLPEKDHRRYNFALLDLGALVCRYAGPRCTECPLQTICDYFQSIKLTERKELREGRSAYWVPMVGLHSTRTRKGFSLVRLAQKARVSKLTIINIEAGRTTPRLKTLRKLADALGVRPEDLI